MAGSAYAGGEVRAAILFRARALVYLALALWVVAALVADPWMPRSPRQWDIFVHVWPYQLLAASLVAVPLVALVAWARLLRSGARAPRSLSTALVALVLACGAYWVARERRGSPCWTDLCSGRFGHVGNGWLVWSLLAAAAFALVISCRVAHDAR